MKPLLVTVWGLLELAGLTCSSQQLSKHDARLLDTARIAVHYNWRIVDGTKFRWLSSRQILKIPYQFKGNIILRDVQTAQEKAMPALTQQFRNAQDPKGTNLLLPPFRATQWDLPVTRAASSPKAYRTFHALTLDGKYQASWMIPSHFHAAYCALMRDNRHWIALEANPQTGYYTRLIIGDVRKPGKMEMIALPANSPISQINFSSGCAVSPERILALPQRFYQYNYYRGRTVLYRKRTVTLLEISAKSNKVTAKPHTTTLPVGAGVRQIAFSDDGKRIVWRLRQVYRPPYKNLQPARMPEALKTMTIWKQDYPARAVNSFWISDAEGKGMQQIGYIDVPLRESDITPSVREPMWTDGGTDEPSGLEWLPGGKHISFWIEDDLYRVAVDGKR